jgi:hypothetical protein
MNVLHGYIPTLEFTIGAVGASSQTQLTELMEKQIYVDFVRVSQDPAGGGTKVLCSLLPYGIRKIDQEVGVERIPEGETIPTVDDIVPAIQTALEGGGFKVVGAVMKKAQELLPPFGEQFNNNFITANKIKNEIVLVKRLTGLISYYKGSRTDLMPAVKIDEVVRVPMSLYSQRMYVESRESEISSEKKKKKTATGRPKGFLKKGFLNDHTHTRDCQHDDPNAAQFCQTCSAGLHAHSHTHTHTHTHTHPRIYLYTYIYIYRSHTHTHTHTYTHMLVYIYAHTYYITHKLIHHTHHTHHTHITQISICQQTPQPNNTMETPEAL